MSGSDSDRRTPPFGDDGPMFPHEKIYYSVKDKAEIEGLPEIDREAILAWRNEQLERHDQDVTLRRLLAARARDEAKAAEKKKRKAGAADLEESQRKSSRQRTKLGGGKVGERNDALENYKRQREEKSQRDAQRILDQAAKRDRGGPTPERGLSDADAEGESEVEIDARRHQRRTPTPPRDDPIAELADIQRAKVGRDNFAQVCYYPGFEDVIKDCYARVCLGPGRNPGVNDYRLCSIKGFEKGRPYAMTGSNGRPFAVDQYIIAAHGKATKAWSFLECSMSKATEDEWRRYRITMANEDCKLPTKHFIHGKLDQINALINHRFTEAEITDKINRQNQLNDKINRVEERRAIQDRKEAAISAEDEDTVIACDDELAALMPLKLAFNTTLVRPGSNHVNKEQERLAELNRRNQRLNAENVRKAQLAEMKAKKAKKHLAPGVDDLFEGGSDISRSGTPVTGMGPSRNAGPPSQTENSRSGTPVNVLRSITKDRKGIPIIRKAALDDEFLASMDLGIEIEI